MVKSLSRELRIARRSSPPWMNLDPGTDYAALPRARRRCPRCRCRRKDEVMIALRNRPDLRTIAYQQRINKRELDAQILSVFPNLKAYVGLNGDSNGFLFNSWSHTARTSFNLLNVFRLGAAKKAVRAQGDVLDARELATAMAVMTQVQRRRGRPLPALRLRTRHRTPTRTRCRRGSWGRSAVGSKPARSASRRCCANG
ncbi:hypothetical protein AB5I41_07990 [Sphingomonas sp. MMS24-JH45]